MAVAPIFGASSIPNSHPFCRPPLLGLDDTASNKRRLLFCVPSEHNPVRLALPFWVGTHLIPHPNKVDRGREDAFFVSSHDGGIIAVADGVSGLTKIPKSSLGKHMLPPPLLVLLQFFFACPGRIVAILESNGILKIANVGDCMLRIIREGRGVFPTSPQEHYFDCPYQLSSEAVGQTYRAAMVSSAELIGGTIVMGSDGLFDNVFDHEIISTTSRCKDAVESAKALADLARTHSMDSNLTLRIR